MSAVDAASDLLASSSDMEEAPPTLRRISPDSLRRRRAVHSAELSIETAQPPTPSATLIKQPDLLLQATGDESLLESEVEDFYINDTDFQTVGDQQCASNKTKSSEQLKKAARNVSLADFFWSELSRGYSLHNDRSRFTEKRRKVYAFVQIPLELERFLCYGFLQCVDAFCYMFTFLPLRFLMAIGHLLSYPFRGVGLSSSEKCDMLKVVIVVSACVMMQWIDTSVMYHLVRGQSVIKLYIFYNMLEVADKLFSSFGQDILDALFWTASEPKSSRKALPHFGTLSHLAFAIVYAFLHTVLVLLQATTLNVAFNSHNKALLTIMMSNNFVELKGSVFKKFAKPNLFQMSCSDVRERFHYMVLLSIVVVRNMTAVSWKIDHFFEMVPDLAMVVLGELLVDWLKHAFITKFNEIPAEVYKDFTITIAYDVVKSRDEDAFSDHSDQVSRRMGFIPIPLSILLIRIFTQSLSFSSRQGFVLLALAWVALATLKILNSIVLLGKACKYIAEYERMQQQTELLQRMRIRKSKSVPASPRMSLIDFSDVMQQNPGGTKGFTVSDLLAHLDEIAAQQQQQNQQQGSPVEKIATVEYKTPRRSQSLANFGSGRQRREKSVPPAPLMEVEEKGEERDTLEGLELNRQLSTDSPKRRAKKASECESLAAVQAYTLLNTNDRIEP